MKKIWKALFCGTLAALTAPVLPVLAADKAARDFVTENFS